MARGRGIGQDRRQTSDNKEDTRKFLDWLVTPADAKLYGERSEISMLVYASVVSLCILAAVIGIVFFASFVTLWPPRASPALPHGV